MGRKYLLPALLALGSVSAFAEGSNKFLDIDADKDGAVSQAEYVAARLNTSMEIADTNGDGSLSQAEYEASMEAHIVESEPTGGAKRKISVEVDAYTE